MPPTQAEATSIISSSAQCPSCATAQNIAIGPYLGEHEIFRRMRLARCVHCSLVFAHPHPSDAALSEYYAHYWDGEVAISTPSTRRYYIAQSLSRIRYLERFGVFSTPPAILDVGAGLGLFHDGLQRLGKKHTYSAVEADSDQLAALRNRLGAATAFARLDDVPDTQQFDLVILSHVLEHLHRPHDFFVKLTNRLRPGGMLFVEVPNEDYRYKALFESHLLFFNLGSLHHFLTRYGDVIDVSTVGKEAAKLYIAHVYPKKDPLRLLKEIVKTAIAVTTPDFDNRQIERFEMDRYGGDRQWLRALLQRPIQ